MTARLLSDGFRVCRWSAISIFSVEDHLITITAIILADILHQFLKKSVSPTGTTIFTEIGFSGTVNLVIKISSIGAIFQNSFSTKPSAT
jgi:hypothetical protein